MSNENRDDAGHEPVPTDDVNLSGALPGTPPSPYLAAPMGWGNPASPVSAAPSSAPPSTSAPVSPAPVAPEPSGQGDVAPAATGDVFVATADSDRSVSGRGRGAGLVAGAAIAAFSFGAVGAVGGSYAYEEFLSSDTPSTAASTLDPSQSSNVSYTSDTINVQSIAAEAIEAVVVIEMVSDSTVLSTGSGFGIREDGYILTNAHVVDTAGLTAAGVQDPSDVEFLVTASDGAVYTGTVVGSSSDYDLAVVKIDQTSLPTLTLANSDLVVVGDPVVAVGSPLGLDATVTSGIVSAMHRPVTAGDSSSPAFIDAIQTDAAINPGNSGGPLLNGDGEVIGINSAIATGSSGSSSGSIGLGFAITSNQARTTSEQLINTGEATYPAIGVYLDSTYVGEGVQILDSPEAIVVGGPGDAAGLQPGDIITEVDGRAVAYGDELIVAIRAKAPGDTVVLTIVDGDQDRDVTLTLADSATLDYGLEEDTEDSGQSDQIDPNGGDR